MKKGWTTTKLIATGSLAILSLVLSLAGASLTVLTGLPGASGAINAFTSAVLTVFAVFLIREFGTATLMGFVFSVLSLPLPLEGTVGFLPKLLIGPLVGLMADLLFLLLKKRPWLAAISIGFVSQYLTGLLIYLLGSLFPIPGIDRLRPLILSPLTVIGTFVLMGGFGYLGYRLYTKLEDTSLVKRIQGGEQ
ncbi:hypothetical protein HY440_01120 [Candidatus Microgenomates bacterium]|nr:hypothetical protein [Candidatus Microgenomates bacterium]